MPETPPDPEQCQSMREVRAGIDALDAEIVRLLARRFAYMHAAARIKPDRDAVRDDGRKAEVVANAENLAKELGIPAQLVRDLWEQLVEASIDYELKAWDARRDAA